MAYSSQLIQQFHSTSRRTVTSYCHSVLRLRLQPVFILAGFFGFKIMKSQEEGHQFVFLDSGERLVLTLWKQSEGHFGIFGIYTCKQQSTGSCGRGRRFSEREHAHQA